MSATDSYETSNLELSAFLLERGMVLGTPELHGTTVWFHFEDRARCLTLEREYLQGNPPVSVHEFMEALNRLRDIIRAKIPLRPQARRLRDN